MLGNKPISATVHEILSCAYNQSESNKRKMSVLDLLSGMLSEQTNLAGLILRNNKISSISLINHANAAAPFNESFRIEKLLLAADNIAVSFEDNVVLPEHLLLSVIGDNNIQFATYLEKHNLSALNLESSLVDVMSRPGFLFSYLSKRNFWYSHFSRWIKMHPALCSRSWKETTSDKVEFSAVTDDKECGITIKENKSGEFILNTSNTDGKMLSVVGTRRYVSVIQTAFLSFALGRLGF